MQPETTAPTDPTPEPISEQVKAPPPPPEPPPFISFIFRGAGSAEFEARRHPGVSPMMLAGVHAYLETVLSKEFSTIIRENEEEQKRRAEVARKTEKRQKFMPGGRLFGGRN